MSANRRVFPKSAFDWRKAAARLAREIPAGRLHPRVMAWLKKNAKAGEPWAAAVSGGADSVALLLLLWAHFPKERKRLAVLHYDHAMREDSAEDVKFVKKLAAELGLKFAASWRQSKAAAGEAELREARWGFFRERLKTAAGRMIFLGHQRDDIVETMLMRLARGSGTGGLSAPRPVKIFADGVVALRPLLDIGGGELRVALRAAGVAWREDSSNASDDYLRNRVRRRVVPAWSAAAGERDLAAGVARSRALLEEDDEALEAMAAAMVVGRKPGEPLKLGELAGQPRALWRRVLRKWLEGQAVGGNFSAAAVEKLLGALMAGGEGRWSAGRASWVEVRQGSLKVQRGEDGKPVAKPWRTIRLQPGKAVTLPTQAVLNGVVIHNPEIIVTALKAGRLDGRHICLALAEGESAGSLKVRGWKPGDRYRPLGAPGRRKLQDLFTDKKIPAEERFMLPVVCSSDGQPVWVPGLPPAESRRVKPGARRALWLTYLPAK
jgi:tRNA(Ile)-lysidine synthase